MMRKLLPRLDLAPRFAAAIVFLLPIGLAPAPRTRRQITHRRPAKVAPVETAKADAGSKPASKHPAKLQRTEPNRTQAYYHLALASVYEDDAISEGRTDEVNQAIEQYKLALDADPDSAELNDDLADLYFRV